MYYRGAQAAIVVYDVTSAESFERAQTWVKELQRQGSPNVVVGLAGNKVDMASARQVEGTMAKSYAEENGLIWMETSAKTGVNVNELFVAIAKKLPKTPPPPKPGAGKVDLAAQAREQPKQGGCCG